MRVVLNSIAGFIAMVAFSLFVDYIFVTGYELTIMIVGVALFSAASPLLQFKGVNGGKKPCPYMGVDPEVMDRLSSNVRLPTALGFAVAGSSLLFIEILRSLSEATVSGLVFAVIVGVVMGFVSLSAGAASMYLVVRHRIRFAQDEIVRSLEKNLSLSDDTDKPLVTVSRKE